MNDLNVTCSPDFFLENSTCFPICQEWNQFPDDQANFVVAGVGIASLLAIVGGMAVIVGSVIRYKRM